MKMLLTGIEDLEVVELLILSRRRLKKKRAFDQVSRMSMAFIPHISACPLWQCQLPRIGPYLIWASGG